MTSPLSGHKFLMALTCRRSLVLKRDHMLF